MEADFITRIILDDKKFNDTLYKVRKSLDLTGSVTNGITSSLKGMAGQIAAAAGAYELMDTATNSNYISQTNWNDILGTAKESVDSFFTSLSSGDWSVWEKGVANAITLSKKYTQAMRNMRMAILVGDVRLSTQEKDLNKFENQATDTNASKEDREKAFVNFQAMGKETIDYIDNLSDYVNGKLSDILQGKGIKADKNVRNMIFKYLDPSTDGAKLLEEYSSLHQKIQNVTATSKVIATNQYDITSKAKAEEELPVLKKQMAELTAMYPELEQAFRLRLNFGTQEELDQLFDIIDRIVGYEDRLESVKTQISSVTNEFKQTDNKVSATNPIVPEGSIAALEKRISTAKTNLRLAVDPQSRIRLESEIKSLEAEKHIIEFQYKHPNSPGRIEQNIPNLASLSRMPRIGKVENIESPIKKRDVKNNNDFASSLMTISNIMGSITSMTNEGAAAWIAWGGNLLSSIAAAIPAITSLIGLKSTEAVVNGVASATQTPLVGWLLAGAAAASVIGAIMSIPKFATGGIVEGNSTFGDMNLARVNAGEMILNGHQQGNLFQLLNSGGTTSVGQDSVEFKIRGQELYGVLSNYKNRRKKIL